MLSNISIIFFSLLLCKGNLALELVTRDEWGAKPPNGETAMSNPVPYVIIHHSASPPACYTNEDCIGAMQSMQNYHQNTNGWSDIGYSFGVGGDNRAYIGRGWSTVGAHAPGYNSQSIGICVIGDWTSEVPPESQLQVIRELIDYGVELGMVSSDYVLYGHREVTATECPGNKLFQEISTWDHFQNV